MGDVRWGKLPEPISYRNSVVFYIIAKRRAIGKLYDFDNTDNFKSGAKSNTGILDGFCVVFDGFCFMFISVRIFLISVCRNVSDKNRYQSGRTKTDGGIFASLFLVFTKLFQSFNIFFCCRRFNRRSKPEYVKITGFISI